MATAYKPRTGGETSEDDLDTFAQKLHSTIESARSKMSDEEVEEADKKAKAIFDRASAAARASRRRA